MSAPKPVPCPVCGEQPEITEFADVWQVACEHWDVPTPHAVRRSKAAAIAAWNRAGGKNANAE